MRLVTNLAEGVPRDERVVGTSGAIGSAGIRLGEGVDQVVRQYGNRVYELMMEYDASVSCAVMLLKAGILSDGMQVSSPIKPQPGVVTSRRGRSSDDQKLAEEIVAAFRRSMDRLEEPIDETWEEMLDAFGYGVELAEIATEWGEDEDRGRVVFKSVTPKPRQNWQFRVDASNRVVNIYALTRDGGWDDLDPAGFAWLTWNGKNRDPRGRSGLRPAYNPWNLKLQQYPELAEYLHHFAQPVVAAVLGENADPFTTSGPDGKFISVDPLKQLEEALDKLRSRGSLALPKGSTAFLLSSAGDGQAYHGAFDRWDMEIFRAVLGTNRPIQEAHNGSVADSTTSLSLVGLRFTQGRRPLCRMIEKSLAYPFVLWNWGKAVADRLTPVVSFGNPGDISGDLLKAFAMAYQAGFLDEAQIPALYDRLGLPPIDEAAMKERARLKAEAAKPGGSSKPQGKDGVGIAQDGSKGS